ncbi:MAG TPA: hypothetical protein DCR44_08130 [Acholeplasmatales bacterium]|nr:MAG: hypothetical protein A2Y16_04030 [Tenericutes bacterium GWF2_57_13]HAQ57336.1 hypothetical protein [Acholeplasmatales bacterium]
MKKFIKTYLVTLFFTNLVFVLIAGIVRFQLNITYGFAAVEIGAVLTSLFVAAGIRILMLPKGNAVLNAVLGLLVILPGVVVLRPVFSIAVFRYSFVIFLVVAVAALGYAVAVVILGAKARKEAAILNRMLEEERSKIDHE